MAFRAPPALFSFWAPSWPLEAPDPGPEAQGDCVPTGRAGSPRGINELVLSTVTGPLPIEAVTLAGLGSPRDPDQAQSWPLGPSSLVGHSPQLPGVQAALSPGHRRYYFWLGPPLISPSSSGPPCAITHWSLYSSPASGFPRWASLASWPLGAESGWGQHWVPARAGQAGQSRMPWRMEQTVPTRVPRAQCLSRVWAEASMGLPFSHFRLSQCDPGAPTPLLTT